MGLTIHYTLRSIDGDTSAVLRAIEQLRTRTMDLPFDYLGDLIELHGQECDPNLYGEADEHKWLILKGVYHQARDNQLQAVSPSDIIAYVTRPGEGCEPALFGVARYREPILIPQFGELDQVIQTEFRGWRWQTFCKTQFASNPTYGGVENFVRCHQAVIGVLDHAHQLGILEYANDESGYWRHRDVDRLSNDVVRWNRRLASIYGAIKDQSEIPPRSPIGDYPDFEHLEADEQAGKDDRSHGQNEP